MTVTSPAATPTITPTLDGPLPLSARPMRESDVAHVARTGTQPPPKVRPLAMQNTPPGKGVVAGQLTATVWMSLSV